MATVLEERNATEPEAGTAPATIDRLAVIVPVYNEDRTVAELLRRLEAQPCVSQIIIVDDGSTDRTWEELEPWRARATFTANSGADTQSVIVLQHDKNRGKGRAIRTGLDHVTCSHVIIQDADLEYDPADINKLWTVMQTGEADVVFGSRYLENSALQRGRWLMQSGVRFLNLLVRMLYGIKLTDEATCYKMFRTIELRRMKLKCERFEFCPEVVAKISLHNLIVQEAPIQYHARGHRDGKKLSGLDAIAAIWQLVASHPKLRWCQGASDRFGSKTLLGICVVLLAASFLVRSPVIPKSISVNTPEEDSRDRFFETYDLGVTTPGFKSSRDIQIQNTSSGTWNIVGSSTTCGCTKVALGTSDIAPGGYLKATISVNSPFVQGPFSVAVQFNSDRGPIIGVTIHGSVTPSFSVIPSTLRITKDTESGIAFNGVLFTAKRISVNSTPTWCDVNISEADGQAFTGMISVRSGTDCTLERTGKLIFTDETGFRQSVEVILDATRHFSVFPSTLHFGEIEVNATHSKALVVKQHVRGCEVSPPEILCSDEEIQIAVVPAGLGVYRATVSVREGKPGFHSHDINVVHEGQRVTVPVIVKVTD